MKKQLSRQPGALKEGLDKIARMIQVGNQYVALMGSKIVGVMRVELRGGVGVISRVAVRPEYRKRRIGTLLVEYGENLLEHSNASCIEIDVYGAIEQQKEFYENMGYEEIDKTKREAEEIVVMRKDLCEDELVEDEL